MILSLIYQRNAYINAVEDIAGEKVQICTNREEALRYLPEADIIITVGGGYNSIPLEPDMLSRANKLKWVFSVSAGVEKLPLEALKERKILVTNTSGVHAVTIAEYVLGGLLYINHNLDKYLPLKQEKHWIAPISGEDLDQKTICIIGAGHIGAEIGRKAKAFDMKVLGIKRTAQKLEHFDEVHDFGHLRSLLPLADFVVMAVPLNSDTYHLMGEEEFALMKENAVFVNIARGDTVDEEALIRVLQEKRIKGALLDVFHEEPLPVSNPLWELENVILTPHSSAISKNVTRKVIKMFKENYERYQKSERLINEL